MNMKVNKDKNISSEAQKISMEKVNENIFKNHGTFTYILNMPFVSPGNIHTKIVKTDILGLEM